MAFNPHISQQRISFPAEKIYDIKVAGNRNYEWVSTKYLAESQIWPEVGQHLHTSSYIEIKIGRILTIRLLEWSLKTITVSYVSSLEDNSKLVIVWTTLIETLAHWIK